MMEERAGIEQEAVEPRGGTLADGNEAAFSAFAFANVEDAGVRVVIRMIEVGHFRPLDAGDCFFRTSNPQTRHRVPEKPILNTD
jgi:hypothetical protein